MLRKLFCSLIMTAVVISGTSYAQSAPSTKGMEGEVGRYQLFQGTYTSIDIKRQQTSTHAGVFMIDTKTGKVKRYLNKIDADGNYVETWMPTEGEK